MVVLLPTFQPSGVKSVFVVLGQSPQGKIAFKRDSNHLRDKMHTRTNHFLIFKCIVVSVLYFSANLVAVDLGVVVAVIVYSLWAIPCAHSLDRAHVFDSYLCD